MATVEETLTAARKFLGYTRQQFWTLYNGLFGTDYYTEWCAAYLRVVSYYGGTNLYAGGPSNYVPTVRDAYIEAGRYLITEPQPGDVIFFSNSNLGKTFRMDEGSHTGIITAVSGSVVSTIEGNLGDRVKTNSYQWSDPYILGAGRPLYDDTPGPVPPGPDPPGPFPPPKKHKMPLWMYLDNNNM